MALSILGIGTVSALGSGVDSLITGLEGEIEPRIEKVSISTKSGERNLPIYKPRIEGLDRFVPKKALRRIDGFAQIALLSTYLAIENAGIEFEDNSRVGVIFGSGYGPTRTTFKFLDNIINDGDIGASPTHFANSVHNSLASQVSIFLKLTGPCSTITCFEHTLSNVLFTAQNWLDQNIVDYVLVGLGDEYCDVLGYSAAGLDAGKKEKIQPFEFDLCTYLPGEGHITFLMANSFGAKNKYANIEKIQLRKKFTEIDTTNLQSSEALIINTNGWRSHGKTFSKINMNEIRVGAYASLYGSMPIGCAFDLAIGAICLKEKKLFLIPEITTNQQMPSNAISGITDISGNKNITCLEYCDRDEFNLYTLSS